MSAFTGTVKFFNDDKGYGFIVPDEGGEEVFVHRSKLPTGVLKLDQNQRVSYQLIDSGSRKGNGKQADQVKVI